jgi:hypothetical protein
MARAIPVDWRYARALAAVAAAEVVDIPLLMADCDLERCEVVALLNAACYQLSGEYYVDPESDMATGRMVLH